MQLLKIGNEVHTKNTEVVNDDKVKLSSAGGIAVMADSSPALTADNDGRSGWLHTKAGGAEKFNLYIYGNVGSSHQFTLGDLKTVYMCCSVDKWDNSASVPFINIYTKPTGSGDAEVWYHSRITYSINMSNQKIIAGEHINLWCKNRPELRNENRYLELETKSTVGDSLDSEELLYVVLGSDSGSVAGTKILVSEGGYNLNDEIKRNIKFIV